MSNATEPVAAPAPDEAAADAAATAPCANCGHPRNDRYCPKCGQNDRDYIRSLPPLLGDILKETFELDGRIRRTIKPLFLRPGELPAEFSRNRRARYVSPIRLYLVASIGFFFLVSVVGEFGPPRLDRAGATRAEPPALAEARQNADVDALKALLPRQQQHKVDALLARPGMFLAKSLLYELSKNLEELAPCTDCWREKWDRYLLARAVDVLEDPAEGVSLLVDSLPFALFVTLPAYALLLMLFFMGNRRFFTEHLVFAVQLHTFAFIVFAASMLLPEDDPPPREAAEFAGFTMMVDDDEEDDSELAAKPPQDEAALGIEIRLGEADDDGGDTPADAVDAVPHEGRELRLRRTGAEALRPPATEDSWDIADFIELGLTLWVHAYHYLALRRYYGNGRLRTAGKWFALTLCYGVLLIPGIVLSAAIAVVRMG